MYEQVTAYIGKLKPAHWNYPDQKDAEPNSFLPGWCEYDEITSEFMHKMYEFVPNGGQNYDEVIYKATGRDGHDDLTKVDVSRLDGDTILFMIFSRVRGERFSDGLFGSYVADGTMDKWLGRLKELDEKK